jgi:hypothetical protein
MTPDLARRCALLTAALGFALLDTRGQPAPPEVQTVRRWLDNWTGIGHVVTGMQRQDYDLALTRYDGRGWSAAFFVTGDGALVDEQDGHSLGNRHPGGAVQVAAWNALGKTPGESVSQGQPRTSFSRETRAAAGSGIASQSMRNKYGRPSSPRGGLHG